MGIPYQSQLQLSAAALNCWAHDEVGCMHVYVLGGHIPRIILCSLAGWWTSEGVKQLNGTRCPRMAGWLAGTFQVWECSEEAWRSFGGEHGSKRLKVRGVGEESGSMRGAWRNFVYTCYYSHLLCAVLVVASPRVGPVYVVVGVYL